MLRVTALSGFGVGSGAAVAGSTYSLSAAAGSYSLTGAAATVQKTANKLLTAAAGSYSLTGTAVSLTLVTSDPYWSSVKLLMGWNGTHGSTTMVDESSGAHSLLTSSVFSLSNAQFVFGPTALFGPGGSSENMIFNDHVDFSFGTGPYTIEFRLRPTAAATMALVLKDGGANNFDINLSGGAIALRHNSSAVASGGTIATNTWYAVCVERGSADKCRIYLDGAMVASGTSSANIGTGGSLFVASRNSGANQLEGYMDELRITKGVARYDSDSGYTVAVAAFPRF